MVRRIMLSCDPVGIELAPLRIPCPCATGDFTWRTMMRGLRPPVSCRDIQSVIGLPSCRHDTKMPDLDGQAHHAFM